MLSKNAMKVGARGALNVVPSLAREMSHIAPAAISPYMVEVLSNPSRWHIAPREIRSTPPAYAANRIRSNLGKMRSMSSFPTATKHVHPDLVTRNDNPFDPYRFFQDDFFNVDFSRWPFLMLSSPNSHLVRPLNFNISEDEKIFQLHVDVPGVKAGDLHMDIGQDGRVLRLSGERKHLGKDRSEPSTFNKSFVFDKNINIDNITADLKDGVMTITAPKIQSGSQQVISIPVADVNIANKSQILPDEVLRDENESEIYESTGQKEHAA
jgi:HSP20 family protein